MKILYTDDGLKITVFNNFSTDLTLLIPIKIRSNRISSTKLFCELARLHGFNLPLPGDPNRGEGGIWTFEMSDHTHAWFNIKNEEELIQLINNYNELIKNDNNRTEEIGIEGSEISI